MKERFARWRTPLVVYVIAAGVYLAVSGPRLLRPSPDNHFVHLATSFMHGQLGVMDNRPPGNNDWACYDESSDEICPWSAWPPPWGHGAEGDQHWYISFPPLPAILIMPAVAIWGLDTRDTIFWALLAGLSPTFLYVLLRTLRESKRSDRTEVDDLLLTTLYAFGTVFFFVAVQGTVWFAANVVTSALVPLLVLASLGGKRPLLMGLAMAALFLTRPNTAPLVIIPLVEILAAHRRKDAPEIPSLDDRGPLPRFVAWLRGTDWRPALLSLAILAAPVLIAGGVAMWMNEARFGRPTEFGHRFLMINWRGRIERWGLFSYHYLGKNLGVFFGSLPWLTTREPHVLVSRHGLALWFTTPALLLALWPKRAIDYRMRAYFAAAGVVAVLDLMYQNSGWIQFGYRFATDYLIVLFALIALGGRKIRGPGFILALVFAIAVNLFGAITFDRAWQFYDDDATQDRLFQPD